MANRNKNLENMLGGMVPKPKLKEAREIPKPDTRNREGHAAYALPDELKLLSMLNTLKMDNQFYRTAGGAAQELKELIAKLAKKNPFFVAQCIVYSRCVGEGMRTINNLAAVFLAPYISGYEWAKRFYSIWNKQEQRGGVIFRPDDMSEILEIYSFLNSEPEGGSYRRGKTITNAMKKGFAAALERMDTYSLLKYKGSLINVINVSHPNPELSKSFVKYNGEGIKTLSAIYEGVPVSADTWEAAQSGAGQIVAKAKAEGKLNDAQAEEILKKAKKENWAGLLVDNRLGILAALRNIRNILLTNPSLDIIKMLCNLLSDSDKIRTGKVMPYQIDLANTVLLEEFQSSHARMISQALLKGYELALPNLAELLPGNNLVIIDLSGSMNRNCTSGNPMQKKNYQYSAMNKASLIGMTIAKATNADVIQFGSRAKYFQYNPNADVFTLAKSVRGNMGATHLETAWELALSKRNKYDRVFILSDCECNGASHYRAYQSYVEKLGGPYVYSVDLAAYGTAALVGPKVRHYYGYGYAMFDDITTSEFNPLHHIEKVRRIEF